MDGRVNSFNVEKIDTQSSNTTIDLTSLMVQNNLISGIKIQSSLPTTLVSLRSVWYPSYPSDQVTFYDIQYGDEHLVVTANTQEAGVFTLPSPLLDSKKYWAFIFKYFS